jgi:hypothetical protein
VRDSSRFLSGVGAARRVRWPSSFGAGGCVGRDEEVVVPARPAALRVPWTDVLSILVNDFVGGVVARAADEGGPLVGFGFGFASSDGREGAREGI